MTKAMLIQNGIVIATVHTIPSSQYFFARNGEPKDILCHINQGGVPQITSGGNLVLGPNDRFPMISEKVVLIRASSNPNDRGFTKADQWVNFEDWQEAKWTINARTTFRAIAYDHRNDGHFQSNTAGNVELVSDQLINLLRNCPRGGNNDSLSSDYKVTFAGKTLSQKVRWERLDGDDKWTECDDPRPTHVQF